MQQVSCLCLLDLSAAFDTLDHFILLHRLSTWLCISSVSLPWFTSYLLSRTSAVPPHTSPLSPLTCGVSQGSVLGPVLFNIYTTPLSFLISASSISHLPYADDTQLFISLFLKMSLFARNTITLISSVMSSNYLTRNPSKIEFLLIGLPQKTSKIFNPSVSLPSIQPVMPNLSAKNLGLKFDSTLSFSKQILSHSSACHYHIRDLRRFRHTLDVTTASTIATALVHSRLDYCNFLYNGLPITQIKRLQHTQNELVRAVIRATKHFHISSAPKSLHLLKVKQRIQYEIISIKHNLFHITEPKYLHMLTNVIPPSRTRSSDHLYLSLAPVFTRLKFADRSFRNSSPHLWNSLPINLRSFAPDTHQSTTVISSTNSDPFKALSLSPAIAFFRSLKPTSSLIPTLHNLSAFPSFPTPSRPASFNQS